MKRTILLSVIALFFAGFTVVAVPEETTGTICTLTNEEVQGCCCEKQDNGKLYCTKAKKEIDNCCCKAAGK